MLLFKQWLSKRDLKETEDGSSDPASRFQFNGSDDDFNDDHENTQLELFKRVISKYPEETLDFLTSIASRGDEEISGLLKRVNFHSKPKLTKPPRHPSDHDDIVIPMADRGGGGEED